MAKAKKLLSVIMAGTLAVTTIVAGNGMVTRVNAAKKQTITMKVGQTRTLKVNTKVKKGIVWKSSKKKVVTVNQKGKVKAISAGKATITAKKKGKGVVAKFAVKVSAKKNTASAVPTAVASVTQVPVRTATPGAVQTSAPTGSQNPVTQSPQPQTTSQPIITTPYDEAGIHLCNSVSDVQSVTASLSEYRPAYGDGPTDVIETLKKYDETYFNTHSVAVIAVRVTAGYSVSLDSVKEADKDIQINTKAEWTVKEDEVVPTVMITKFVVAEFSKRFDNNEILTAYLTRKNENSDEMVTEKICELNVGLRVYPES